MISLPVKNPITIYHTLMRRLFILKAYGKSDWITAQSLCWLLLHYNIWQGRGCGKIVTLSSKALLGKITGLNICSRKSIKVDCNMYRSSLLSDYNSMLYGTSLLVSSTPQCTCSQRYKPLYCDTKIIKINAQVMCMHTLNTLEHNILAIYYVHTLSALVLG